MHVVNQKYELILGFLYYVLLIYYYFKLPNEFR